MAGHAEQVLRTLMRTTDIVVTGLFSPAAVAAIGLADLFARLPLRIGLGGGTIALQPGHGERRHGEPRRGGHAGYPRRRPRRSSVRSLRLPRWRVGLFYVWALAVVAAGFHWGGWAGRAAEMMEERGSVGEA